MTKQKNNNVKATTALARRSVSQFALERFKTADLAETLRVNLGSTKLRVFDLPRVKIPAGGSPTWTFDDDDAATTKELVVVIVGFRDVRAYWQQSFADSGGGSPPDCSSADQDNGLGDPGADVLSRMNWTQPGPYPCGRCPHSPFGTARDGQGRGQACKQMRTLFLIPQNSLLPIVLPAPPTSIQPIIKFFLRLAGQATRYCDVFIKLSLSKENNADGIPYSRIKLSLAGKDLESSRVPPEFQERIMTIREVLQGTMEGYVPQAADRPDTR